MVLTASFAARIALTLDIGAHDLDRSAAAGRREIALETRNGCFRQMRQMAFAGLPTAAALQTVDKRGAKRAIARQIFLSNMTRR